MKIKSLLAAVSMVAISASSAHAIDVSQSNATFSTPLALELDLAKTPVKGFVNVLVKPTSGGNFAQGVLHDVVVNLPAGMTFNNAALGGDIETATNGAGSGTNGTLNSGGTKGASTVTYRISPTDSVTNNFIIKLDVKVSDCLSEGSGVQVIVSNSGGFVENDADGDNTGSTAMSGFAGCKSAWNGKVNGTTASGSDTFVALTNPTYTTLGGDAVLGTIKYTINTAVGVDAAGTDMVQGDLDNTKAVVSTIVLPGNPATTTNPASSGATLSATNGTLTGGPVTWTLTQTASEAVAGAVISVTAGTAVLPNMQPTVSAATSKFKTANGFISTEPGATGNLEFIQREGQAFGDFDWNSGPAGSQTLSVYRVTGLKPGEVVTYTATLSNSLANGTLPAATVTGDASGEAVLVSTTLPGIPADVVRYDLGLNFETARKLDVDRLLSKGDIVTNYGGGANISDVTLGNDPEMDADNSSR